MNQTLQIIRYHKATFLLAILSVLGLIILLTGCTTAINSGHVISVTERGFGIVLAQSTQNETPEIKLGFFSSEVTLEPVSTNKLNTPNFADTFALTQGVTPFSFGVNETVASGDYQTGSSSNLIAAQPQLWPHTNINVTLMNEPSAVPAVLTNAAPPVPAPK